MSIDRDVLIELRARVVAAKGASEDLDADLMLGLGILTRTNRLADCPDERPLWWYHDAERNGSGSHAVMVWPVTWSLDAATRLVERVLPGVFYLFAKGRTRSDEPLYAFELLFGTDEKLGEAEHNEPCLAILAALLSALLAQETAHG